MVAFYVQSNTGQGACKTGITIFKGLGRNLDGGRLVDAEDNDQVFRPMLFSQFFYLFLYRKTYGACSSSDETGGCLIHNLGTCGLETVGDCCPGNVIPFTKDDYFFSL
jgi:hypothetical protein